MTMVPAEGGPTTGPTVLRMLLGAQLRRLREASGVTREGAGWEIRSSESKISRMELGRVGFKERDVADLLTLYGVTDGRTSATRCSTLARDANSPGWWHRYGDVLPTWFQSYLGLEAAAALIRTLRGAVRPRPAADPGLRPGGRAARPRRGRAGRDRAPGRPADAAPAVARTGPTRRSSGPSWTRRRCAARSAAPTSCAASSTALIEATKLPNIRLQVIPFAPAGTPPPAAPSPSCASPTRTCPTSSTSSSSPARSTSTSATTSTTTRWPWSGSASRPSRRSARRTSSAGLLDELYPA